MLRILSCLVLVASPVQTWTVAVIVFTAGSVRVDAPGSSAYPLSLPDLPAALLIPRAGTEWRSVLSAMHVRRQLAVEYFHSRRPLRRRRIRVRRCRRLAVLAWRQLRPVLAEVVRAELETTIVVQEEAQATALPALRLPVQIVVVTPDYSQTVCPDCGGPTKRKRSYYSHPQDINLEQPTILQVYREVRRCCHPVCGKRFTPLLDFVEPRERFTKRAKQTALASVTEDGVPIDRVPQRMWRDFHVRVAQSTVCDWLHAEAERDLGEAEYTQWVVARFSGVVGIDEVHLRDENGQKQYLVVAVDPLNDRTILFDLLDSNDGVALADFLQRLKALGINPRVVITDMWEAYRAALAEVFPEAVQQWCVFHVIQDVMKYTRQAMLAYRRGLPQATAVQKAIRKELWEARYLLLKSGTRLSERQRALVEELLHVHQRTTLAEAYYCKEAILALFRESQSQEAARARRDMIVWRFGHVAELKQVMHLLQGDSFERMIVYLDYENLDKTNNAAERTNRTYQKGEKGRYRARTSRTRLHYVKLQARQRNRRSAEYTERVRRKQKRRTAFTGRVDAVTERAAGRLTAQ